MKIVGIIQARMGSTRLPGKVLADVHGKPMLRWLLDRIHSVRVIDEIVVATTLSSEDDRLVDWLSQNHVKYFRGSESDVLERFYECAKKHQADLVVRITADDPLKDPGIISQAIAMLVDNPEVDYCSNSISPTYPEGLDIEIIRFSALEKSFQESEIASEREHVTPYIWKNPDLFKLAGLEFDRNLSHWRWTVDKPDDLEFVRAVYQEFINQPLVPFTEIISFLESNPKIIAINIVSAVRNEGYLKSLSLEKNELKP
jgi:spore coat polysaccharide biosynthesis protein SpsF